MILIIIAILISGCDKNEDTGNPTDPSDLSVEIVSIDHGSGEVVLQAVATNAVEYLFYVGSSETPEESNATGLFEYRFETPGSYIVTVRAYGISGRYIKVEKVILLSPQTDPIPLGRGYITPASYEGYLLIWNDEFNGNAINSDYWNYDLGDGCPGLCGWGNNELEYYRKENTWVADSVLVIEARKENYMNRLYTSSRIKTEGKFSFRYGRVDIRALLPSGQGIWPALWTLGDNISSVGWPACGEIDIMEMIGGNDRENEVHGTVHWDNGEGYASYGRSFTLGDGEYNFAEAYHVFTLIWDETSIRWLVDDHQFNEIDITGNDMSEFHQPHWFIFNVAVGGNWPGSPDATTVFPQQMKVDYIRVFQQETKASGL